MHTGNIHSMYHQLKLSNKIGVRIGLRKYTAMYVRPSGTCSVQCQLGVIWCTYLKFGMMEHFV